METEAISCSFCHSDNPIHLFTGKDYWYGLPGTFNINQCGSCGLIYLNPRPTEDEISHYYPQQYAPHILKSGYIQQKLRTHGIRKQIRAIHKHASPPGKALDIGCASGEFLAELRNYNWQVKGVEVSKQAAATAQDRYQLDVTTGKLEDASFPDHEFELVTLWHVLEHLYNPQQTLNEIARITKPGGKLFLTVPNLASWERRIFAKYWAGWDIPRHIHLFTLPLIKQMLEDAGWQFDEMSCLMGRHFLLKLSISHWGANTKYLRLGKVLNRFVASFPVRIGLIPYFAIAEKLQRGSIMGIAATRK